MRDEKIHLPRKRNALGFPLVLLGTQRIGVYIRIGGQKSIAVQFNPLPPLTDSWVYESLIQMREKLAQDWSAKMARHSAEKASAARAARKRRKAEIEKDFA